VGVGGPRVNDREAHPRPTEEPWTSGAAAVVYMYMTYLLMGSVFYTLVNIAYGSMAPALTQIRSSAA
jgi:hypothetical protein